MGYRLANKPGRSRFPLTELNLTARPSSFVRENDRAGAGEIADRRLERSPAKREPTECAQHPGCVERIPAAMHDYHRAWVRALVADGRYRPGIYCHARNAAELYAAVRAELAAAGVAEEPRFWVASAAGWDVAKRPEEVGHPFAWVWQGAHDITETWGGVTLRIDANVARTPAPSAPAGPLSP